jgi:hypothetical protein
MSKTSFYQSVYCGIDAINHCPELMIKFPITMEELHKSADEFCQCSTGGVLNGCVAALDGWLCRICVPSVRETNRITSYFSGHYQCYGLNVQATCNANCRFTSVSIMCPGGIGDSKVFFSSAVYDLTEQLPDGFYVVADNAYTLSCKLLIPYSGKEKQSTSKDVFNFYLSQLCIRVEQAFGLLVNMWRVLKKPLEVALWRTTTVVEAAMRLHNFCIDHRDSVRFSTNVLNPEALVPNYEEHLDVITDNSSKRKRHAVREAILHQLQSDGRQRPQYNLIRNQNLNNRVN